LTQEPNRPVVILSQRGPFERAREIAKDHGGELPSLEEFLRWLNPLKNDKSFEDAKKDWYWLREARGLNISGACKIDYEKGTIKEVTKRQYDNLPEEQKAWAYRGSGPLALDVGGYDNWYKLGLYAIESYSIDDARVAFVKVEPKTTSDGTSIGLSDSFSPSKKTETLRARSKKTRDRAIRA
jgi:hypothetical protein